jgi:hypothetical protein
MSQSLALAEGCGDATLPLRHQIPLKLYWWDLVLSALVAEIDAG